MLFSYCLFRCCCDLSIIFLFFFFMDAATPEIYTLSLHDALPICRLLVGSEGTLAFVADAVFDCVREGADRKSTRLNSSHSSISYAVFCLKKKKNCFYSYGAQFSNQTFNTLDQHSSLTRLQLFNTS